MGRIGAFALGIFVLAFAAGPAGAACVSQLVCGDDGVCRSIEICDQTAGDLEMTAAGNHDETEMSSMPAGAHDVVDRAAVSETLPANCKLVDICGTWKQVCN